MSYAVFNIPSRFVESVSGCGCAGLGTDAASLAVAAHQADLAKWEKEAAAYTAATRRRSQLIAAIEAAYKKSRDAYVSKAQTWAQSNARYQVALTNWKAAVASIQRENARKVETIVASNPRLKLPAGMTCVSKAAHDQYARECVIVKGVDGFTNYGDTCAARLLPVCSYPAAPTSPGAPPVAPVRAAYPPAIPPPRAKPTPPIESTTLVPAADPPVVAPEPETKSNLIKGGLIALVVLGGGVVLYKTFAKPKAA